MKNYFILFYFYFVLNVKLGFHQIKLNYIKLNQIKTNSIQCNSIHQLLNHNTHSRTQLAPSTSTATKTQTQTITKQGLANLPGNSQAPRQYCSFHSICVFHNHLSHPQGLNIRSSSECEHVTWLKILSNVQRRFNRPSKTTILQ